MRDLFHYDVQTMVKAPKLEDSTRDALNATYTQRSPVDKAALDAECVNLLDWHNSPHSLRPSKPPRTAKPAAPKPPPKH